MQDTTFGTDLALATDSSEQTTGWAAVDSAITQLRLRFGTAESAADYRDIGKRCVALTETLGNAVYGVAPQRTANAPPGRGHTRMRLERYLDEVRLAGIGADDARRRARSLVVFAEQVTRRTTSTRREAGLATAAVIMLANTLCRLDDALRLATGTASALCAAER